jgi:hypothetical protein
MRHVLEFLRGQMRLEDATLKICLRLLDGKLLLLEGFLFLLLL